MSSVTAAVSLRLMAGWLVTEDEGTVELGGCLSNDDVVQIGLYSYSVTQSSFKQQLQRVDLSTGAEAYMVSQLLSSRPIPYLHFLSLLFLLALLSLASFPLTFFL